MAPHTSVSLEMPSSNSLSLLASELLDDSIVSSTDPSGDPLVEALKRLLEREGGHVAVGLRAGINDQSLYQIASGRPDSKTGSPKSVGPSIRKRLTARYPDWLDPPDQSNFASAINEPSTPSIAGLMARLGQLLQAATPATRAAVAGLLAQYAQEPAHGQRIAQAIELLLKENAADDSRP